MKQLLIQVLLIVGVLAVAWRLLASYGQRAQALRRIGLLVFAAFAVWSILDPDILNRIARLLGIGRGADLVLYGLVIAFLGFVVTTFRRFREMEVRYTRLARRIALDEAPSVTAHIGARRRAAGPAPVGSELVASKPADPPAEPPTSGPAPTGSPAPTADLETLASTPPPGEAAPTPNGSPRADAD